MICVLSVIAIATAATSSSSGEAGVAAPSAVPSAAVKAKPRVSSPGKKCPYARLGVAFYRNRFVMYQLERGAPVPTWRKPRNCADARYLANVWAKRALAARKATEHWRKHRFDHVIRRLDRGLAGSPMAGTGRILEREGRRHGVSPYFMAAVAATESSLGHAACGPGGYNAWGLGNCGTAWSVPAFRSWDQAIAYYARFLTRWEGHSTPYSFRGYAACDECWGRKVSEWMQRLFGVPAITRYP